MSTYEFLPNAFSIPIDNLQPLHPTRALSIHLPPPLRTHYPSQIQDLTPYLTSLFSWNLGITPEHLLSAHKASILTPHPPTRYTLEKQNWLGTHLAILDVEGTEIASWRHPLVSLGVGRRVMEFRFPSQQGPSLGVKEVKEEEEKGEGGLHHRTRKAERFVKEGTMYFWEAEPEAAHQLGLYEVFGDDRDGIMKREVARYAQKSAHEREGLLVLDGGKVDELVVVLTLCAMLEGNENFLK